jgi:hypothetical protein
MPQRFKLVAAVLAFVFLASTLSALGAGLRATTTQHECCGPRCSMQAQPVSASQANPASGPCCDISSGKPVPAIVAQVPNNRVLISPLQATAGSVTSKLPIPESESRTEALPFKSSPPRSVLCTFLI